jgi:hypothetical protein
MSHGTSRAFGAVMILVTLGSLAACGGGQAPAESPEVAPETSQPAASEPPPADSGDAGPGEHTMPDGTTMPGHEHDEGSEDHQH